MSWDLGPLLGVGPRCVLQLSGMAYADEHPVSVRQLNSCPARHRLRARKHYAPRIHAWPEARKP